MTATMACPTCGTTTLFGWVEGVNEPSEPQRCVTYGHILGDPPALCQQEYAPHEIIDSGVPDGQ